MNNWFARIIFILYIYIYLYLCLSVSVFLPLLLYVYLSYLKCSTFLILTPLPRSRITQLPIKVWHRQVGSSVHSAGFLPHLRSFSSSLQPRRSPFLITIRRPWRASQMMDIPEDVSRDSRLVPSLNLAVVHRRKSTTMQKEESGMWNEESEGGSDCIKLLVKKRSPRQPNLAPLSPIVNGKWFFLKSADTMAPSSSINFNSSLWVSSWSYYITILLLINLTHRYLSISIKKL